MSTGFWVLELFFNNSNVYKLSLDLLTVLYKMLIKFNKKQLQLSVNLYI